MSSTISITYKLQGDAKSFKELINDADGLKKAFEGAAAEAEQLPKKTRGLSSMVKELGGLAAGFVTFKAAAGVIKNAVGTMKDFERANSTLAAVLGKSADEINNLTRAAMDLGRTTEFTASEVTELQTALARLGFSDTQITDMQESVLKFAAAVGTDLASAADFSGSALRSFGLDASDSKKLLDIMAASTSKSALSFGKLQTSIATVGPVANAFGLSARDTVSLLGVLSNAGFDATSAATALRNILLNLADSNGKLAKGLGHTANTMPEIMDALKELKDRGVDLNETLKMTDKRSVAAFNAMLDGEGTVRDLYDALGDCDGALDRMYTTMTDNLEGATKSLASAWEGLILQFKNSTGPMKDVVKELANIFNGISDILGRKEAKKTEQQNNIQSQAEAYVDRIYREYDGDVDKIRKRIQDDMEDTSSKISAAVQDSIKGSSRKIKKAAKEQISQWTEFKEVLRNSENALLDRIAFEDSKPGGTGGVKPGGTGGTTPTTDPNSPKSAKGLTDAIQKYRQAVEGAVAANAALGGGTTDVDAKLKSMESGLQSLIKTYGAENGAVKALIQEYNGLAAKRREANKATSVLSVDELKGLKGGVGGTSVPVGKADTNENKYKGLTAAIRDYRESVERAVQVNAALGTGQDELSVRIDAMESGIRSLISRFGDESEAVQRLIKDYNDLKKAKAGGMTTTKFDKNGLAIKVPAVSAKSSGLDAYGKSATKAMTQTEALQTSIGALGGVFRDLAGAVGDSAAAWLEWGSNLLSAISQALPQLTALFVKQNAAATANTAAAATGGASAVASIPYVGPVLAVAAVASILAALANLPKFAKGGVITGPTMGLMGEYHGAVNNPEVIAPLSTLREYIQPAGIGGHVDFRIRGRDLEGVLRTEERRGSRS